MVKIESNKKSNYTQDDIIKIRFAIKSKTKRAANKISVSNLVKKSKGNIKTKEEFQDRAKAYLLNHTFTQAYHFFK